MANRETLAKFNARVTREVKALHDRMAEQGHPVTPEEAKFLWVAGQVALAELVNVDPGPLSDTLQRLAAELPKVGDAEAARWREMARDGFRAGETVR